MSKSKRTFSSNRALPFSDVVVQGNIAFVSGQVGFDESGVLADGGIEEQTRASLANIKKALERAGLSIQDVVRTGCYLVSDADMAGFNKAYTEYFPSKKPARVTVFVAGLPVVGSIVEIDAVAAVS